jgi:Rrf2 family protein
MKVTKAVDYGLKATVHLALNQNGDDFISVRKLCDALKLRRAYLLKVLKMLGEAGIVRIQRGAFGGYRLARDPEKIALKDIVEAIDGPVVLSNMVDDPRRSRARLDQSIRSAWLDIQATLNDRLAETTLADFCADLSA